jgi:hypothetical protein
VGKVLLLVLTMATGHQEWLIPWYDDDKLYDSMSDCLSSFSGMKFDKPEKGYIIGVCIPADQYRVLTPDNYREPKGPQ